MILYILIKVHYSIYILFLIVNIIFLIVLEQLVISQHLNSTDTAYDSAQSILIDKSVEYPSDPDLFRETILSTPLIRALIEIGPCQPGIDGKHFIFPKNENGQSFLLKWYDKITKSNFPCKRNWLVYSPRSNKMFCFPCFLFRTISQHHYQWSDPSKGVSNFRKGHEKIVKHEQSNEHKTAERIFNIENTN